MQMGIVGKTNTGKSTFFSAATLVDAEIGNRAFVTIKPNQGTGYVTSKCPHSEKFEKCDPVNSRCVNGVRLIPVSMLDVAGLIPGAHEGKGLGNRFMNDLMQAKALIHVLDVSGTTDAEGNPARRGDYDIAQDVRFLEEETAWWIKGILEKNWNKVSKQAALDEKGPSAGLAAQLSGLGIGEEDVVSVLKRGGFSDRPDEWGSEEMLRFAGEVRGKGKPVLIAANKIDKEGGKENFDRLVKEFPGHIFVACCAEAELALRRADRAGAIKYVPGKKDFEITGNLGEKQKKGLDFIRENILNVYGGTGVQEAINKTAFDLLGQIVVYPVQDANKWVSGKGNVLPDAYLVRKGSTAIDLAGAVHTDFVKRFIAAVDCRTGQKIGKEHELKDKDVVKIQLSN